MCVCMKDMCLWGGEVAAELPKVDQDAAAKSPSSFFGGIDKMVSASSYIFHKKKRKINKIIKHMY